MTLLKRKLPCADVREVAAADELAAAGRPHARQRPLLHRLLLVRVVDVAGERRAAVVVAVRGVGDEVLAPAIDDVAPRVGERIRRRTRSASRCAARSGRRRRTRARTRAVRRLDLRVEERALLEVQRAVRAPLKGVDRVVAVLGAEAVQDDPPLVGLARRRWCPAGTSGSAAARRTRRRRRARSRSGCRAVGEDRDLVGPAVAVGVLEDDQLVVRRLVRADVRVGRRRQHPQPAARVERHRQRVGELGELALRGEQRRPRSRRPA